MNKTLAFKISAFFFLLLSISATTAYLQSNKSHEDLIMEEPFDIVLQIDKLDHDQYNLSVAIELDSECYVISPFSEDNTYGHFDISIVDNPHLLFDDTLLEIPNSVEEFDPILNRPVKFVRVNTMYKQKVKVVAQNDFEVSGLVWFVLEPSCIPYDVAFTLSYQSGILKAKKTGTTISKEYKQ